MSEKPKSVYKAVDLIVGKLKRIDDAGDILEAMDLSTLPDSNTNFIDDINNRLDSIETLLNAVNDKLTILTSKE